MGQAPGWTACGRNYAEGATVPATFLDFEVGPGLRAGRNLRFFQEGVQKLAVGPDHLRHLRRGQLLAHRSLEVRCSLEMYQAIVRE